MPEHDLEPPRFSRRALERILNDWSAVKAMLLSGMRNKRGANPDVMYEEQLYLESQSGTARLDKFTHCLLVKCSVEVRFLCLYLNIHLYLQRSCPLLNQPNKVLWHSTHPCDMEALDFLLCLLTDIRFSTTIRRIGRATPVTFRWCPLQCLHVLLC